jgi:methylenetetrahydrofolate--tRNA-(uracil-5-)-methyltransferase
LSNAVGLLKEEMRTIGSVIMKAADENKVPAGSALAVDRDKFSAADVTKMISEDPNIEIVHEEVNAVPAGPCIIATGPLTFRGDGQGSGRTDPQ